MKSFKLCFLVKGLQNLVCMSHLQSSLIWTSHVSGAQQLQLVATGVTTRSPWLLVSSVLWVEILCCPGVCFHGNYKQNSEISAF